MEKEFIPYEQALDLKELGFDESCLGFRNEYEIFGWFKNPEEGITNTVFELYPTAPLYQQAFRWFREKHNLKGHIEVVEYLDETPDTYHWCVFDKFNSGYDQLTYEEAELECLKKLIEIVKEK